MDPHTAAAWQAMSGIPENGRPRVVLATASPFKFPRAIFRALGLPEPEDDTALPERLGELTGLPVPPSLAGLDRLPVLHRDVIPGDAVADDALKRAISW
jgi:threonine synthase